MISAHFLDSAQKYEGLDFIENRDEIQREVSLYIKEALRAAGVQAQGTFIKDIDLPSELEQVLQERQFAKQQTLTHRALTRSKLPNPFDKVETIPSETISIWAVAGASVPGTGHEKSGTPCQDAHGYQFLDDHTIIMAMADGLGAAAKAQQGSKIAVEKTLASLAQLLPDKPITAEAWATAVKESFEKTRDALAAVASKQNLDIGDYGTTLMVVVLSQDWLVTGHIGDGAVVALFEDGRLETVRPPLRQEYANQTVSITQENVWQWVKISARPAKVKALAILSDGLQLAILRCGQLWTLLVACAGLNLNRERQCRLSLYFLVCRPA